jgi:hypothetical protein
LPSQRLQGLAVAGLGHLIKHAVGLEKGEDRQLLSTQQMEMTKRAKGRRAQAVSPCCVASPPLATYPTLPISAKLEN